MSFLKCNPCVFVIGKEYEILAYAKTNGIFSVIVDGVEYDPVNSGVLSSEKPFAKIRVPQTALNNAKEYVVTFKETIDRKAYFSVMGDTQTQKFAFKPLEKTENINLYHIADVHYKYENAEKAAGYFGDDTDLFVVNGDIGEVETIDDYYKTIDFVGKISKGEIPVLFVRGNHDTRGKLAELFTEYFPSNGAETYFYFEVGCLAGFALDCGEDKVDDFYDEKYERPWVYGGVNKFHAFRERELKWLKKQTLPEDKILFSVSHICPVQACSKRHEGGIFDIERELYTQVNAELERMNVGFMLCGHIHDCYVMLPEDGQSYLPHNYPVVVGSKVTSDKFYGAAIVVNKGKIDVKFVDQDQEVYQTHTLTVR